MISQHRQRGGRPASTGLLSKMLHRKRAVDRTARCDTVFVFSKDRLIGRATLVDESSLGAKLRVVDTKLLDQARFIVNTSTAMVSELSLVWIKEREAGYEYINVKSLRGFVSYPHLEHVREFWASIADQQTLISPNGAFARAR